MGGQMKIGDLVRVEGDVYGPEGDYVGLAFNELSVFLGTEEYKDVDLSYGKIFYKNQLCVCPSRYIKKI
jgi:hypothetical protein